MVHWHNQTYDPLKNGRKLFKGGETTVVQGPAPTPQPSTAEAIDAWVKSMPTVFAEQQRQAPLEAQQQMALAQQYAGPMADIYKAAQEKLYPGTSAIQENLATKANAGINATTMPEWMRKQYQSDINAQLGSNASSPIGAEYVSRGMQNQLFNQQKYYNDLGLTLAGRQPLATPQAPATTNYASTFTPSSVMGYMGQNYGNFLSASKPLGFTQKSGGLFGMF